MASLVLPIVKGNKLEGHLFGIKACPEMIIFEGIKRKINPAYEEWQLTDQLLFSWLLNMMTIDIVG